jgi:hypothetical protein
VFPSFRGSGRFHLELGAVVLECPADPPTGQHGRGQHRGHDHRELPEWRGYPEFGPLTEQHLFISFRPAAFAAAVVFGFLA